MVHNPIILSYRMPPTIFCNTTIFSLGLLLEFEVNLGTLKMIKKALNFPKLPIYQIFILLLKKLYKQPLKEYTGISLYVYEF